MITTGFSLRLGYGIVLLPPLSVESSTFDPSVIAECVDSRYNVDIEQCRRAAAGHGLASTTGSYLLVHQRMSLALALDLW